MIVTRLDLRRLPGGRRFIRSRSWPTTGVETPVTLEETIMRGLQEKVEELARYSLVPGDRTRETMYLPKVLDLASDFRCND